MLFLFKLYDIELRNPLLRSFLINDMSLLSEFFKKTESLLFEFEFSEVKLKKRKIDWLIEGVGWQF